MKQAKRPRISAVIPVKANLNGLKATVTQLQSIDPHRIEIIVVDGGGCKATKRWLLENQEHIDHIRSSDDQGIYSAMNYGKSCANGDWVWFAGAGDLPIASTWQDWLNSDELEVENSDEPDELHVFQVMLDKTRETGVPDQYPARWDASMCWRNTTHHQGVLYPRELIQSEHFDANIKVLADYALHLKLWSNGNAAKLNHAPWAQVASGGISRAFTSSLYFEEWRFKRSVLKGWRLWAQPFWLILKYSFKKSGINR